MDSTVDFFFAQWWLWLCRVNYGNEKLFILISSLFMFLFFFTSFQKSIDINIDKKIANNSIVKSKFMAKALDWWTCSGKWYHFYDGATVSGGWKHWWLLNHIIRGKCHQANQNSVCVCVCVHIINWISQFIDFFLNFKSNRIIVTPAQNSAIVGMLVRSLQCTVKMYMENGFDTKLDILRNSRQFSFVKHYIQYRNVQTMFVYEHWTKYHTVIVSIF